MVLFLSYFYKFFNNQNNLNVSNEIENKKNDDCEEEKEIKLNYYSSKNKISIKSIEKLVFEGGGVKGIAFLGSLEVIKDQLPKIKSFAGTSVGSISASLLAVGYGLDDLKDIIWNTDFKKFFDHEYDIPVDVYSLIEKYGICSGNNFNKWISNLIKNKTKNDSYTFGMLWEEKKVDLVLTTTNVSYLNPLYISYRNYPDMPIKDGVRMSMSIPMIFTPVKFEGNYYADGGIIDNYPIHVFDGKYPGDLDAINDKVPPNKNTLGFRLISDYDDTSTSESSKKILINNVQSFGMAVFQGSLKSTSRQYNGIRNWDRSIQIFTDDISAINFGISEEDKERLYKNGFNAAVGFFSK